MKNYLSGDCRNDNRPKNDFYQTPYHCTRLLLDAESFSGSILEPAAGKGAITRILEEKGLKYTSYDLFPANVDLVSQDFLKENRHFDNIITNPPYNISFEFIHKAKEISNHKIAFLLPLNYTQGKKRYSIWQDTAFPLQTIYIFSRYLLMSADLREDGKCEQGMVVFAWFVWNLKHKGAPTVQWLDNSPFLSSKKEK